MAAGRAGAGADEKWRRQSLDEIATLPLSDDEPAGLAADTEHIEAGFR